MQRNWRIGEWDCVTECVYERGEKESWEPSGTGEQWSTESERELKIEEWIRWDSLGFCYFGQTVHFTPFFFFEFWPESAGLAPVWCVLADTDWFNANWSDSVQVDPSWRESARNGNQKKKKKWTQHWRAGSGVAHCTLSRTRVRRPFCRIGAS